jgi:C4-dicarboxylate-specific signal transduction histidine kinase
MLVNTSAKRLRFSTLSLFSKQPSPTTLAEQRDKLPENAARQAVLRVLLICTLYITALFFCLLMVSYFLAGHQVAGQRGLINGILLLYLIAAYKLVWPRWHNAAALMLVSFYALVAATAMWQWGINLAFSTLLMSVTISLAGILLGARFSLYAAAFLGTTTLLVQVLTQLRVHLPDESWQQGKPSSFGEALGYCLLFVILGVVAWVFGRQIERSLTQARAAEAAVQEQKQLLAVRLKERTEKLKALQLQEMQQLYRFAELGQMSTALLHELANHLTALTLDIDTLGARSRTDAIERAKQSIGHLDKLVDQVRSQLHDRDETLTFDCLHQAQEVVTTMRPKFMQKDVLLDLTHHGSDRAMRYIGDPVRFSQILTILLTNAMQATADESVAPADRRVRLELHASRSAITVKVSDWGPGISSEVRKQLFKPFYSTKQEGMGIGLFITKQILGTHFGGIVELESAHSPTTFKVVFPAGDRHGKS